MRKRWLNVARVGISVGALAFLFWKIGLGKTLAVLRTADLRVLSAAFGLFLAGIVIRAFRWQVLLRALDLQVGFRRLVHLYFVGSFFNAFLPTGFGGDVVRILELAQDTRTPAAIGTVLVDRMTGLLVLFVAALGALPLVTGDLPGWLNGLLVGIAGGGLLGGALLLEGNLLRRLTAPLPSRLSLAGQGPLARIFAAVSGCGWRAILGALGVSVVFNVANVLVNWLCGVAVGIHVGPTIFVVFTPLLAMTLLVSISVGGLGVRDWMGVALFATVGVDRNTVAAMTLTMYAVSAAAGLVGGLMYGIEGLQGLRQQRG